MDRGLLCVFIGYARNHSGSVYRMINMKTGSALITRDIQWTSKFIGELKARNIKEYLIDIAPEKQSEIDAKTQEPGNDSQAEDNISGNVSEK